MPKLTYKTISIWYAGSFIRVNKGIFLLVFLSLNLLLHSQSHPVLTEFMPNNPGFIKAPDQQVYPWVEIQNNKNIAIDLGKYAVVFKIVQANGPLSLVQLSFSQEKLLFYG
jgi:hypothetical protein